MKRSNKRFRSVSGAMRFIEGKVNNGYEYVINDSLMFGVGYRVYTYREDMLAAGLAIINDAPVLWVTLEWYQLRTFLTYLKEKDGYLIAH